MSNTCPETLCTSIWYAPFENFELLGKIKLPSFLYIRTLSFFLLYISLSFPLVVLHPAQLRNPQASVWEAQPPSHSFSSITMVLLARLIQLKFPNAPRQTWIGVLRPLLPLVVCTFAWSDCAIIILRFNGRKLNTNKLNWDLALLQQTKQAEFVAMLYVVGCWCDGYLRIRKVACCSHNNSGRVDHCVAVISGCDFQESGSTGKCNGAYCVFCAFFCDVPRIYFGYVHDLKTFCFLMQLIYCKRKGAM